jgi:N-hydroxyarylamine O-acetyltransferase
VPPPGHASNANGVTANDLMRTVTAWPESRERFRPSEIQVRKKSKSSPPTKSILPTIRPIAAEWTRAEEKAMHRPLVIAPAGPGGQIWRDRMEPTTVFDLDAYLARIEYDGLPEISAELLRILHRAHATHIPFENLDIMLGKSIRLDLASLQAKLVRGARGGYCFEQNALFAAALEEIGFPVTRLAARVWLGVEQARPRTHMALLVDAEGERWLADVGFGGWGLLEPIPLREDHSARQGAWSFRLRREGSEWILSSPQSSIAGDQYSFTLEPQLPVDYEPPNHYCATHPESRFTQTVTAQLPAENVRTVLRGNELVVARASGLTSQTIANDAQLLEVLREVFGLHFPEGTRFCARA